MFKTTLKKVLIYTRKLLFVLFHIPEVIHIPIISYSRTNKQAVVWLFVM